MADQSAEFVENCGFELSREYTPPEGYRLLQIGEVVQKGDIFLAVNGEHWPAKRTGETVNNNRYLRRIEVEQAAVPEPENCGFEGNILREVSQPCAPCDSRNTGDMTTSEQIAEIEGQVAEPEPQTDYTPFKGWRVLQPGEALQPGDAWAHPQANLFEENLNLTGVAGSHGYYLRRQVCEGRWKTRGGEVRNVTRTPDEHGLRRDGFPWWDASFRNTWRDDGRYTHERQSAFDLLDYLGPITPEPQAEPEPQPQLVQVREGRWRTRGGEVRNVILTPAEDLRAITYPWYDARYGQTWLLSGRYNTDHTNSELDLVDYLGPIETESKPQPEPQQAPPAGSDAERQIRALHEIVDAQAETISRLHNEIRDLHNEIGGLQRKQAAAVEAANKQNTSLREQLDAATAELQRRHPNHVGRSISTDEWMDQFARDASVNRLQADRNDLAGKVVTLREQLQQANDRVAYLEALLPIVTACTTAQTMVRDMLGHMRCLMVLQHTVNRGDFCTLLESILEVFDEAECGDGDDDAGDTSDTSDTDTTKSEQG